MASFCPYCSDEISPETTECPSCDHAYTADALSFISLSHKAQDKYSPGLRKHTRFPLTLKVVSYTPEDFIDHYTLNVSLGGLFIETNAILRSGKKFDLKMFLFDAAGAMEVACEVVWVREEEKLTLMGKLPRGMGVRFLNLSTENIERLIDILNRSLS